MLFLSLLLFEQLDCQVGTFKDRLAENHRKQEPFLD